MIDTFKENGVEIAEMSTEDYQAWLEEEWFAELAKRFTAKVNRELMR